MENRKNKRKMTIELVEGDRLRANIEEKCRSGFFYGIDCVSHELAAVILSTIQWEDCFPSQLICTGGMDTYCRWSDKNSRERKGEGNQRGGLCVNRIGTERIYKPEEQRRMKQSCPQYCSE